ncbi:MAG: hypothetical protein QF473_30135, partial [Planctomycetota bacterium]|nr:hypothetical protein [Planctomycetota bacterium]
METSVTITSQAVLQGEIVDSSGRPIPFKMSIWGRGDTPTPNFFPETGDIRVRNLIYSADGHFKQSLMPGSYDLVISRGMEYDIIKKKIDLRPGDVISLKEVLKQSVSTPGWMSVDIGSRTTESNALSKSSRMGRVLNLLAEGIEFAPTLEGQTISDLSDLLTQGDLSRYLKTCPGVYMKDTSKRTGLSSITLFPMPHRPHVQDGGAWQRPYGVGKQFWVNAWFSTLSGTGRFGWVPGTEKIMIASRPISTPDWGNWSSWLFGRSGKNEDPTRNGRFATLKCIHAMEVQPLASFVKVPAYDDKDPKGEADVEAWSVRLIKLNDLRRRAIENRQPKLGLAEGWDADSLNPIHWLRMLNLGYRIPAVVNSHAEDNFHGNGGVR